MAYGQKITELRKNKNMTQSQLGEVLCVSPQAVSKWEHDMAEPDLATIKKICNIFDISVDEFLDMETNYKNKACISLNEGITDKQMQKLSSDVASSVKSMIKLDKTDQTIGCCVKCGRTVTSANLGSDKPMVMCKNCFENQKKQELKAIEEKNLGIREQCYDLKKTRRKSIAWGIVVSLVVFLLNLFFVINNEYIEGSRTPRIIYSIFMLYAVFALVADLIIGESSIDEIVFWFIEKPIRLPRIIFSLDLEGLLFFIVVKIGLAILSFLLGVGMFLIGVSIGCVLASFVFPFSIYKLNKQIKELKTE